MSEEFYDAEIAPVLVTLSAKCQERDIPFLAVVEFAPGETGRTEYPGTSRGVSMAIAQMGARCQGNVDSLIIGLIKYGREHGHNSAFLHQFERAKP